MKRTNEVPEVRVLLLADTHGVVDERVAALAQGCAWIVHAGDVGNAAVLRTLARSGRGAQLAAVRGNNDIPAKWPDSDGASLDALPEDLILNLPGGELAVIHGDRWPASRRDRSLRRAYPREPLISPCAGVTRSVCSQSLPRT